MHGATFNDLERRLTQKQMQAQVEYMGNDVG